MAYQQDIFYLIKDRERIPELLKECIDLSYRIHTDTLYKKDGTFSWSRVPHHKGLKYVFDKLGVNEHFVFIYRFALNENSNDELEIGISGGNSEYIFIWLDIDHLDYLVKKYELKPNKP